MTDDNRKLSEDIRRAIEESRMDDGYDEEIGETDPAVAPEGEEKSFAYTEEELRLADDDYGEGEELPAKEEAPKKEEAPAKEDPSAEEETCAKAPTPVKGKNTEMEKGQARAKAAARKKAGRRARAKVGSKGSGKKILILALIIAAALAAVYVGISIYCSNHFYLGSTVNGVPASGASVEAVKEGVQETANAYQMVIYDANGQTDTITASQAGVTCNPDQSIIDGLLAGQNGFLWPKYLIEGKNYESNQLITVDAAKIRSLVPSLNCVKNSGTEASKNATCAYSDSDKAFVIVQEVYGNTLNQESFADRLVSEITNLNSELHLDTDQCYEAPQYTAESPEIKNFCDQLNQAIGFSITYDLTEVKENVDKSTMAGWIKVNDDLTYGYDTDAMTEFIDAMGDKYNTYGKDKKLHTSYGTDVVVKGKSYGWKIDAEGELAQLEEDMDAKQDVSRDFVYSSTANSHGENDYGNTYVEINLTAQHLFMYKDGKLVIETDFVSGNPSKGNATPVGACQVTYTTRNATLKGDNYASFVNYWMPFNGNVGMHDATWRSKFGGTIYKKSGSHGCVNLPLSAAKTIYENLKKGDCILVYQLDGTEESATSQDTSAAEAAQQSASDVPEVTNENTTQQQTQQDDRSRFSSDEEYYLWLWSNGGDTGSTGTDSGTAQTQSTESTAGQSTDTAGQAAGDTGAGGLTQE